MKFIKKGKEPVSFTKWKGSRPRHYKQDWSTLDSKAVDDIRSSLINEQGNICCYCGKRITFDDCRIEHLRPKSKFPKLKFKYDNLLASCYGGETRREERTTKRRKEQEEKFHCDPRKRDWFDENLIVSPLDPFCESYFHFSSAGEIHPTDDPEKSDAAKATIKHLGLNINDLNRDRKFVLNGILPGIDMLDKSEIRLLINGFKRRDKETGSYEKFCFVIVDVLNQLL